MTGGIHNPADTTGLSAYLGYIYFEVMGLNGEAMRGTDSATLQATWTDAMATALANYTAARAGYLDELAAANLPSDIDDLLTRLTAARAGYLDELAAANLPSDIDDLLSNLAHDYHQSHSRTRVYPQEPSSVIQIATAAAADTFGDWTQVIPIDTVDFDYTVLKVMVEESGAAATYIGQLGYSLVDGTDPTTAQIVGEQRFKVIGTPLKTYHADLALLGGHCPANSKLWGRLKSETVNADPVDISIVVTKLAEITNPVSPVATWPWNT